MTSNWLHSPTTTKRVSSSSLSTVSSSLSTVSSSSSISTTSTNLTNTSPSPPTTKSLHCTCSNMGRENILHYLQEHLHEPVKELEISPNNDENCNNNDNDKLEEQQQQQNSQFSVPSRPKRITSTTYSNSPFTLSPESTINDYLNNNKYYIDSIKYNYGNQIFDINSQGQSPHTLWIGCCDSRAGEQSLSTLPGEIFVHRNIANIINPNDINSQGVIQFAIDVLQVRKVIVCGHTDCGGIWASLSSKKIGGVLDLWLNPIRHIRAHNLKLLNEYNSDPKGRAKKLAELNVASSVLALKRHPSASLALKQGKIEVWGMMYDVSTGYLSEVEVPKDDFEDLFHVHDNDHDDDDYNPH
ncbi:NCE103 [Candida oxycetoniae]|uniref:carbonic anhydrase n=1 Tax=Candida oxycetoniae TaxID=497107 RepID=A0AAI9SZN9_9ASCO|nr:NCE103 [Candida oxycetoniae]KAI3405654.2 NCE103 [Candida oxycetoniae]